MTFEIQPYIQVGNLKLGDSILETRKKVNQKFNQITKSKNTDFPIDYYADLGILIHYKKPGICEAFEFGGIAKPTFQGKELLHQPFIQIVNWLITLDSSIEIEDDGVTSYKFGIGLYAPFAKGEPDEPIKGVIIFEEGYYN